MALKYIKIYNTDKILCASLFVSEECLCTVCLFTIQDVWLCVCRRHREVSVHE